MDKLLHPPINLKVKKDLLLLDYLQKNGPKSRVDLSAQLNLTKAAITAITNEMIQNGVLVEKGEQTASHSTHARGRRKILLDINENYKLVFGIVVEKEDIFVGLTNLKGQVLDKRKKNFKDKTYRELLELIVLTITTIMKNNCITYESILGLGVCISTGCGDFIEGAKTSDKSLRLKKDLVHAMPMKITTGNTIGGCLIAQRLFKGEQSKSVLMLRYGSIAESGIMIDSTVYRGFTGNAGGLMSLLGDDIVDPSECDTKLAQAIVTCYRILDPEKIYCFGEYFQNEEQLQIIQEKINKLGYKKLWLEQAMVTSETIFLAPCSYVINCYFYFN